MSELTIGTDRMVTFHYTLKDTDGHVIDQSEADDPLEYLHGRGQIIPGLEKELEGRSAGDEAEIEVAAAQAYGEHHEELIMSVPREAFDFEPQPGSVVQANSKDGRVQHLIVLETDAESVTLDGNHPLAGKDLVFEVNVVGVRDATDEEVAAAAHECAGGGSDDIH
jgi:FKBP-type peptidyl-prolyl cis-trans isomerase SlyD